MALDIFEQAERVRAECLKRANLRPLTPESYAGLISSTILPSFDTLLKGIRDGSPYVAVTNGEEYRVERRGFRESIGIIRNKLARQTRDGSIPPSKPLCCATALRTFIVAPFMAHAIEQSKKPTVDPVSIAGIINVGHGIDIAHLAIVRAERTISLGARRDAIGAVVGTNLAGNEEAISVRELRYGLFASRLQRDLSGEGPLEQQILLCAAELNQIPTPGAIFTPNQNMWEMMFNLSGAVLALNAYKEIIKVYDSI